MTNALELDELSVRYGNFTAVDRLTLTVPRGALFGLLGPNGAGKSSTIRVLTGQRSPAGGFAMVMGRDVAREWEQVKPLFGYVPDRENHFDELTGRDNLRFFAGLYGVPVARIDVCLSTVELSEAGDVPVRGYSLGMRRKLLMARALLHEPPVLYLDEPTANLDIHSASVVRKLLRKLVAAGTTVLLTTHNMEEVEAVCDRVAILCRGKLVALDTPSNLKRAHHERVADVESDGAAWECKLDDLADRERLARAVTDGRVARVRTREFDFADAFLKLTGTAFE